MANCYICRKSVVSGLVFCEECIKTADYDKCDKECPRIKDYSKVKDAADHLPIMERALRLAVNSIPCDDNECPISEGDCSQRADLNDCEQRLYELFLAIAKETQ